VRFGAFVDGVDQFDSGAFRLPYAEAAALDPQARILLEQTHVSIPSHKRFLSRLCDMPGFHTHGRPGMAAVCTCQS
jgi:Beta-ketoacyl synthase, N-terminal domain